MTTSSSPVSDEVTNDITGGEGEQGDFDPPAKPKRSLLDWRPKSAQSNAARIRRDITAVDQDRCRSNLRLRDALQQARNAIQSNEDFRDAKLPVNTSSIDQAKHVACKRSRCCATQTEPFENATKSHGATQSAFECHLNAIGVATQTEMVFKSVDDKMVASFGSRNRSPSPSDPLLPLSPMGWMFSRAVAPGLTWTPPFPPDHPSGGSRPSTARRTRPSSAHQVGEHQLDMESLLRKQLNQTSAELSRATSELARTKAELALLDQKEQDRLRRTQELLLMRECPRSGPAVGDTQFRFVPGCAAREIVVTKKRMGEFVMSDASARKIQRLILRAEEAEANARQARERVGQLEDEFEQLSSRLESLTAEYSSLQELAALVAHLNQCRRSGGDPNSEMQMWCDIEIILNANGFRCEDFSHDFSLKRLGSKNMKRPESQTTEGTVLQRDITRVLFEPISKTEHVRNLWSRARTFARSLAAVKGVDLLRSHRLLAALLNEFVMRLSPEFECVSDGMGFHEFIAHRARAEEFQVRANHMLEDLKQYTVSSATETPIEWEMKARYDEAFEQAGGDKLVDECAQIVSSKVRQLIQIRGRDRVSQDCGYEILGLDELYKISESRRHKFIFELEQIAHKTGGFPFVAPMKERARAYTKCLTKYGNDTSCITDLLRASITYRGIQDVYSAVDRIVGDDLKFRRRDFILREYEDRFSAPKDGYRDIAMLFEIDGVIAEVQLHCHLMIQAKKSGGHMLYRKQRQVRELVFEACMKNNEAELTALIRGHKTFAPGVKDKGGRTSLHYACQHGSVHAARLLLQASADPWVEDGRGLLPLELALFAYRFDALDLLLDRMYATTPSGGRVMRRFVEHVVLWWVDDTAYAARDNTMVRSEQWQNIGKLMIQVVKHHSDYGSIKILETWLIGIISNGTTSGSIERARVLFSAGFDVSLISGRASVMDVSIENGHREMTSMMQEFGIHGTECCTCWIHPPNEHLRYAAINEDGPRAIAALEARADPNRLDTWASNKRTPLMAFAAAGDLDTCKQLIAVQAQITQIDNFRCAAVHYAVASGRREVEEYLQAIKSVPHLGMRKDQSTAKYLLDAVIGGCCGAFAYAAQEADFQEALAQEIPPFGATLLHAAVEATREIDPVGQVARALLFLRADPLAKNSRDLTPLLTAAQAGHEGLYSMMTSRKQVQVKSETGRRSILFGDDPQEVFRRNLQRRQEREKERKNKERGCDLNDDQKADNNLLLRTGLLAFQYSLLLSQLNRSREGHAASFLDILQQRLGDSDEEDESDAGSYGGSDKSKRSKSSKASKSSKSSKSSAKKKKVAIAPKATSKVPRTKKAKSKFLDLPEQNEDAKSVASSDDSTSRRSVAGRLVARDDSKLRRPLQRK